MAKTIYRLDLTSEEFDKLQDKLDIELIEKFKEIEVTDKKINSMKKASSKKSELTRERFKKALLELEENNIELTQYNLRKYTKISYVTSKKYLDLLKIAKKNIEGISINNHRVVADNTELNDKEKSIYDFEKFLLVQAKITGDI